MIVRSQCPVGKHAGEESINNYRSAFKRRPGSSHRRTEGESADLCLVAVAVAAVAASVAAPVRGGSGRGGGLCRHGRRAHRVRRHRRVRVVRVAVARLERPCALALEETRVSIGDEVHISRCAHLAQAGRERGLENSLRRSGSLCLSLRRGLGVRLGLRRNVGLRLEDGHLVGDRRSLRHLDRLGLHKAGQQSAPPGIIAEKLTLSMTWVLTQTEV